MATKDLNKFILEIFNCLLKEEKEDIIPSFLEAIVTQMPTNAELLLSLLSKSEQQKDKEESDEKHTHGQNPKPKLKITPLIDFNDTYMCERGHKLCSAQQKGVCTVCNADITDCYGPCQGCMQYNKAQKRLSVFCSQCAMNNRLRIETEQKTNEIRQKIIGHILFANPSLSLDILTGLPTAQALYQMCDELRMTESGIRKYYHIYIIALDNFTELNKTLGPTKSDQIIRKIAEILVRHKTDIDIIWRKKCDIRNLWIYRKSENEFVILVKTGKRGLFGMLQRPFYESWTNAMKNIEFNHPKAELLFGTSVGMYVGHDRKCVSDDWLSKAQKAQNEAKLQKERHTIRIYDYCNHKGGFIVDAESFSYWM